MSSERSRANLLCSKCFPPVPLKDRWMRNPKHVTHFGRFRANFRRARMRSVGYRGAPCAQLSCGTFSFKPAPFLPLFFPSDMLDSPFFLCDWQCGPINLTGIATTCGFSFAARLTRPEGPESLVIENNLRPTRKCLNGCKYGTVGVI